MSLPLRPTRSEAGRPRNRSARLSAPVIRQRLSSRRTAAGGGEGAGCLACFMGLILFRRRVAADRPGQGPGTVRGLTWPAGPVSPAPGVETGHMNPRDPVAWDELRSGCRAQPDFSVLHGITGDRDISYLCASRLGNAWSPFTGTLSSSGQVSSHSLHGPGGLPERMESTGNRFQCGGNASVTPVNGCSAYKRLPRHLDRRVSLLAQRAGDGHCRMGLARLPRPRRRKPYPSP